MKQIKYGERTVLADDQVSDALMEYAVFLASRSAAAAITFRGLGDDGGDYLLTLLLGPGISLSTNETHSRLDPPDNDEAVARMRAAMKDDSTPPAWNSMPGGDEPDVGARYSDGGT